MGYCVHLDAWVSPRFPNGDFHRTNDTWDGALFISLYVTNFFNNTYGKKMKFFELSKNNVSKKQLQYKRTELFTLKCFLFFFFKAGEHIKKGF